MNDGGLGWIFIVVKESGVIDWCPTVITSTRTCGDRSTVPLAEIFFV